jgi:hypothetical protein
MRDSALTLNWRNGSADWPSLPGWQRLFLTTLIVCLPVPMLAASGLAVPLPSVVYRVAVGLAERTQAVAVGVPGFEAVVAETKETPRRGVIRLSAQERAAASASGAARQEDLGDRAAMVQRTHRPVVVAKRATETHSPHHPARIRWAGRRAATQNPQDSAPVASAEAVGALPVTEPPAAQSGETQDHGSASTPTAPAEPDQQSPRASDEPRGTPGDSSARAEEPRSDAPRGGKTSDPPAASDTPSSGSVPDTPPPAPVDTPQPGTRPVTPPGQTDVPKDTPNPGLPVAPPGQENRPDPVTPPAPVDTSPGTPPITPPGQSNGAGGAPELPGTPELPGAPALRLPKTPGRSE